MSVSENMTTMILCLGLAYIGAFALLTIPYIQTHVVYLHTIKYPFFTKYNKPELYGLSPHKTINVQIHTNDNETLGAWFTFSESYHRTHPLPMQTSDPEAVDSTRISEALQTSPTILFLHGNAATRAASFRVQHYKMYSNKLDYNVLALDYRGFGESSGFPSEEGLMLDARGAFDWLTKQYGARRSDVLVVGHSLGSSVAAKLVYELEVESQNHEEEGVHGLTLLAPFSSIRSLLDTYRFLGILPLVPPLDSIPKASDLMEKVLKQKFDTLSVFPNITTSTLIAHAEDDWKIPISHSDVLFDSAVSSYQSPFSLSSGSRLVYQSEERDTTMDELVQEENRGEFGVVKKMEKGALGSRRMRLVKTAKGSHDLVGVQEGVLNEMRSFFEAGERDRRRNFSEIL